MKMIEVVEMEGLIFFWISWTFWIIATFFLKKGSEGRFLFSLCLLILITVSPIVITVFGLKISLSSLFLFITMSFLLSQLEKFTSLYIFFCSFIVMLAYVCFQLYEFFDPVWLIFSRNWMMSIILVVLAISLQSNKLFRIYILLLGTIQGDLLYAIILKKYSFPHIIGSFNFLDVVALSAGLLACWNGIEFLSQFLAKYYYQSDKQKERLS